jgi:putative membrane protein
VTIPDDEPRDPRVAQANERTLLAWLRTGIGLMAFGFLVARSGSWIEALAGQDVSKGDTFTWIGVALVGLGTLFSAAAGFEYVRVRRAILSGRIVRTGRILPPLLTLLVAVIGLALISLLIVRSL